MAKPRNPSVTGSIPVRESNFLLCFGCFFGCRESNFLLCFVLVASLAVERLTFCFALQPKQLDDSVVRAGEVRDELSYKLEYYTQCLCGFEV